MSEHQERRAQVSRAYAEAVTRPASGGGCCCGPTIPKGEAAKLAGYQGEDVAGLPDDAVVNAFGCGNPVAFSGVEAGQTVLDLGSGAGLDLLIAAEKVGPGGRVIGVDMTDEMLAKARANIERAGASQVEVRKGIIEELPVESGTVDWVISNCVINLSPEKPRVFAEIARVLRPGGQMLVSDIVVDELPGWAREIEAVYNSCIGGAISEAEYLDGLRAAGLTDIEVRHRLVYDAEQLNALVASEVPEAQAQGGGCCGVQLAPELIERGARELAGKVASVSVYARKAG